MYKYLFYFFTNFFLPFFVRNPGGTYNVKYSESSCSGAKNRERQNKKERIINKKARVEEPAGKWWPKQLKLLKRKSTPRLGLLPPVFNHAAAVFFISFVRLFPRASGHGNPSAPLLPPPQPPPPPPPPPPPTTSYPATVVGLRFSESFSFFFFLYNNKAKKRREKWETASEWDRVYKGRSKRITRKTSLVGPISKTQRV